MSTQMPTADGLVRSSLDRTVWLADLTYTQQSVSAETIPQAIGGIATFAATLVDFASAPRIFKYPERLARALETEGVPDLVGFSHYCWNSYLSLAFARLVKRLRPSVITVLGGPHYGLESAEKEAFLRSHPEIDFYVEKEGELAFARLLVLLAETGWRKDEAHGMIGSVHSVDRHGEAHLPPLVDRIRDLTLIPSPYTCGLMDEFFDGQLVPTLQTNRGCPFTCTFCVEGDAYYTKVYRHQTERVAAELDYMGQLMADVLPRGRNELLITDSNFGMFPEDKETCDVIGRCQELYGWPKAVNVTTGKNRRERVLDAIRRANGAVQLSGAVQSLAQDVLDNIRRSNIRTEDLIQLAMDAAETRTNTYSDVVLGLPGDNREKHFETMRQLIDGGFARINSFQLMMLPGSQLCTDDNRRKFGLKTKFRVFPRCFGHYRVHGESLVAAEIDEICVASDSMPYSDYVDCRVLDLFVFALYNDGLIGAVPTLLRNQGASIFRWLEIGMSLPAAPRLRAIVDDFYRESAEQLWDGREELEQAVTTPAAVARYIDGELGNNLLYTYRTRMVFEALDDVLDLARRACLAAFDEHGDRHPLLLDFLDDVLTYQRYRLEGVLGAEPEPCVSAVLAYDVPRFERERGVGSLEDYAFPAPTTVDFTLSDEQRARVESSLAVLGTTPAGVGRFLSKVVVPDLLRTATPEGPAPDGSRNRETLTAAAR
jgi:radical SAM superfamily enzyme YgiQ (UPF0313 family)